VLPRWPGEHNLRFQSSASPCQRQRRAAAFRTQLARAHGLAVAGVSVWNQRTRWETSSPSERISLNWRLIQVPPAVSDCVLFHEVTHLRHLNHSARFWRELARLCPHHAEARRWLRSSKLLAC